MKKPRKFSPLKYVFSNWKYSFFAILVAVLFYELNVFLANWRTLISFSSLLGFYGIIKFFFNLSLNFYQTIKLHSFISLLVTSVLIGILFSLIVFKINLKINPKKNSSFFGVLGIVLASVAPGCAACGIGLIFALGLSASVLTFFPYEGLEISILAILILLYAIYRTAKDLTMCDECKIL